MFQENEWEAFIGILVSETSDANDAGVSLPNWISSDRGPFLAKLKTNFPTLYDTLQLNDNSIWSAFSRGQMSDEEELPVQLAKKMTPFQKVFVMPALLHQSVTKNQKPKSKQPKYFYSGLRQHQKQQRFWSFGFWF
jgi:hypothetical protein